MIPRAGFLLGMAAGFCAGFVSGALAAVSTVAAIGRAVTLDKVGKVVVPDSVPAYLTALYEHGEP